MILQALKDFYERKAAEAGSGMPPYGYGDQNISFCFVLGKDGKLLQAVDVRGVQGKKLVPKPVMAPALPFKRAVGVVSNFSWDNTGYALGIDGKGKEERTRQTHDAFKALHREMSQRMVDDGLRALMCFLDAWTPQQFPLLTGSADILDANISFRLESDTCFLHDRPLFQQAWAEKYRSLAGTKEGFCLVSGRRGLIADLHPDVSGVFGAQSSGALLVSFNLDAFTSYGKAKSLNAPVGERAAFAYTTALNFLTRRTSRQKIRLGDATTVFWAERETPAEDLLAGLFDPPAKEPRGKKDGGPEDDPATTSRIRELLRAAKAGMPLGEVDPAVDPDIRFYVLGLSPNAARLAVRFWNVSTLGQLVERVGRHFRDMEIERQFQNEPEYPPFWLTLLETAPLRKTENVPPLLAGALIRSILTGSSYPRSLFTGVLGRIRADAVVNYLRAAILKAYLVRNHSLEVPMSLDSERNDPAYRLGRLFSLLEKVQKDAINPSATIRDRFFGAASATPAVVFPQLLRLGQHHISKAEFGGYTDKLIAEVLDGVAEFPKHLSLEEQGLFTLGYYHQRNALYRKTEKE